jgi:iron(III) transport system substrate-binding protein
VNHHPLSRRWVFALLAGAFALPLAAQTPSLMLYEGPDRAQKLAAAAAKEQTLNVYTAMRPQDVQAVIGPFEKKHGIKVNLWRSGSDSVMRRVITEGRARRFEVDAVMIPSPELEAVRREKLLQPISSPYFADLNPGSLPAHREWATVLMNVLVQAYNTAAVRKEDLPKTYQELADAKWKGKLGIESQVSEWYTTVVREMGEEKGVKMFDDIAAKSGISARVGMSLLHNLVVAGEVPLALTMYIDLPEKSKRAGKPIDWFALEPVVAMGFNLGVARNAPHPNAALLFVDYMLSPETQKLLASLYYYPVSGKAQTPYPNLRMKVVDPAYTVDTADTWMKSFEDVVIKRAK